MPEDIKQTIRSIDKSRKDHITNLMKKASLQFPYTSFDRIRATTPLISRYNASMDILTPEDLTAIGLEEDHMPELLLCRWKAAQYVAKKMKENGVSFVDAAELCKVDKSIFTRYGNPDRPIGLEAEAYVPLCLNVLHESCNKIMFGEEGKIVLPGVYSYAAKAFDELSEEAKDEMLEFADGQRKMFELMNPTVAGTGLHRDPDELIRERLWQLVYDSGRNVEDFFGEKQARRIRNNIKSYFENNPLYRPRMSFTVFLAFETEYALDYFISEDFAFWVPCYYKSDGEHVLITDRKTLRFVGDIFAVDEATSIKMTSPVIAKKLAAA